MRFFLLLLFMPLITLANQLGAPSIDDVTKMLADSKVAPTLTCDPAVTALLETDACKPKAGCGFYQECMNKLIDCKKAKFDYFNKYGDVSCNKFSKLYIDPYITRATKLWTRCTMKCLQQSVLTEYLDTDHAGKIPAKENQELKCQRYYDRAFETHAACFTNSGLCYLMPPDQQARIMNIMKLEDLLLPETKRQMVDSAMNCGSDYLDQVYGEGRRMTKEQKAVLDIMKLASAIKICRINEYNPTINIDCDELEEKAEKVIKRLEMMCN